MKLIIPLLALGLVADAAETPPHPVAFDSFTYIGRDVAFEQPLPPGHYRNPILAGYYPDADATVITTQAAGGFVGALVGVHARIEQ